MPPAVQPSVGMYGPATGSIGAYSSPYAAVPAASASAASNSAGAARRTSGAANADPSAAGLSGIDAAAAFPLFFIRPGYTKENHAFTFSLMRNDRLVSTRITYVSEAYSARPIRSSNLHR